MWDNSKTISRKSPSARSPLPQSPLSAERADRGWSSWRCKVISEVWLEKMRQIINHQRCKLSQKSRPTPRRPFVVGITVYTRKHHSRPRNKNMMEHQFCTCHQIINKYTVSLTSGYLFFPSTSKLLQYCTVGTKEIARQIQALHDCRSSLWSLKSELDMKFERRLITRWHHRLMSRCPAWPGNKAGQLTRPLTRTSRPRLLFPAVFASIFRQQTWCVPILYR